MRRSLWMVVFGWGCSAPEPIDVSVDASGELPVISWDIGKVHEVSVWACDQDCESACEDPGGPLRFGNATRMWSVGFGEDRVLGEVAGSEPQIEGPFTYGDEDVPGDERHEVAQPLEAGVQYGVEALIYEPCSEADPACAHTAAQGCSLFEVL